MPDPLYTLPPERLAQEEARIDAMTQAQAASFWRFAPSDDPIIQHPLLWERFVKHFREVGGMSPAVSKSIGWG